MVSRISKKQLKGIKGKVCISGFRPIALEKKDFELGVERGGQDTSGHFEGDLGPYVQYCPIEASEQKIGQKPVF